MEAGNDCITKAENEQVTGSTCNHHPESLSTAFDRHPDHTGQEYDDQNDHGDEEPGGMDFKKWLKAIRI